MDVPSTSVSAAQHGLAAKQPELRVALLLGADLCASAAGIVTALVLSYAENSQAGNQWTAFWVSAFAGVLCVQAACVWRGPYLVAARARLVAWCAYWLWMTAVACTVLVGLAIALPDQVRPPHVPGRVCRACHIHAGSRRALLHAVHCQASDPSSGLLVASCSAFLHATHLCKPGWMDCAVASATGSAGVLHSAAWPFHTAGQRNRRVRRGSAQRQGQRQD